MGFSCQQWLSLVAGALTMMVQGSLYVFGTITPYIASYLYYQGNKQITINDLQIIVSISVLSVSLGMVFPKFKLLQFNNRTTSLISMFGVVGSVFSVSFTNSFYVYIAIYGVVFGVSIGYGYVAPIKNCVYHIPDKKGLCVGVCIMGFGIGALFFNLILLQLINPDNDKFDEHHRCSQDIANNLPIALRIICGLYITLGLIGCLLIRPPKIILNDEDLQQRQKSLLQNEDSHSNIENEGQTKTDTKQVCEQLTYKQILFDKKIIYCMAIVGLTMPFGGFVAFYYKQYGLTKINDDRFLTILGSVASVVNGLSRLLFGVLMDKIAFRIVTLIMNVIFMATCAAIYFAVQSKFFYALVVLACYSCYAGNYAIYPPQTIRILGAENGSKYYWITFSGFAIGAVLQFVLHYFLVNKFGADGFLYCFIIFGVFLVAGTVIAWTAKFDYHPSELKYIKKFDLKSSAKQNLSSITIKTQDQD